MAPPGKVIINASTPDAYGRSLPHGVIYYDPAHGELIGNAPQLASDVGQSLYMSMGYEVEILGSDVVDYSEGTDPDMWMSPESQRHEIDLVGDEEGEESEEEDTTEETEEEGEEAYPEEDIEGPPEEGLTGGGFEGGGGGSYAPGGFGPPPAPAPPPGAPYESPAAPPGTPVPGPVISSIKSAVDSVLGQTKPQPSAAQVSAVARSVAAFQRNLSTGNPGAVAALNIIKNRGLTNPRYAQTFNVVAKPFGMTMSTVGRGPLYIKGEPVIGDHAVSRTLASIVKTVLSPVAWGIHGVGTVSNEVGKKLNHLAGKL